MSFEWIPYDKALPEKSEIAQIARALGIGRADAVLGCLRVWAWVDDHVDEPDEHGDALVDGAALADLDYHARIDGFGRAMNSTRPIPWVRADNGGLIFPNADRWMTRSAKRRLREKDKKRRQRDGRPDDVPMPSGQNGDICPGGAGAT
jgi:hypothetical protein